MKLLVINGTYTTIELAYVSNRSSVAESSFAHIYASTKLLPAIHQLCTQSGTQLSDLTALAVNVGPGPFTTMRSIIATINGVAYASHIPLLALNGIEAFARSYILPGYTHTCIVLNAFCGDVYYAQYDYATQTIHSASISVTSFIAEQQAFLQRNPYARVAYAGNGCTIYQHELATAFGMHAIAYEQVPEVPPLKAIIDAAHHAAEQNAFVEQLAPLYLKPYVPHNER